ncbi:MAG TPA: methyltransferase domain-containing protein [Chloroflexota bacterium]
MNHDYKWRWAHVDLSDRSHRYVAILNQLRPDDDPENFPNTLSWIDAQPGERILEVGCGNGAVARAVAHAVPGIQGVVAVDASVQMIAEAQRRADGSVPVTFQVADAHDLPFPDGYFDRCYSMETFVILSDPYRAFLESVRVLRPGGLLCVWESDCDVRAMQASDLDLSRRLMRFVGDREFNGAVGRQLIAWLKDLRWEVEVMPAVSVGDGKAPLTNWLLDEWLADAVEAAVVTAEESDSFLAEMRAKQANGSFFSYTVNFRITARKPEASRQEAVRWKSLRDRQVLR